MIFVFGSNLSGVHGASAAKFARINHQAKSGVGEGRTGNSYALPTKTKKIEDMPLDEINEHVQTFIRYAEENPRLLFQVTAVGTGLAKWTHEDIAPMFKHAPQNCLFDSVWKDILGDKKKYWGTY